MAINNVHISIDCCCLAEVEDMKKDFDSLKGDHASQVDLLVKVSAERDELKKQLSGERFWVGHYVPQIGMLTHETTNLHNYAEEIPDHYAHHTEVMVMQTKKASDT